MKQSKKQKRSKRIIARERKWAADYEDAQGRALNDPDYKLPEAKSG